MITETAFPQTPLERIATRIGGTPLYRISRIPGSADVCLYAKAEFMNFGGSVKSRTAFGMLRDAERSGKLKHGDTIIEASTGNQGIALSMLAAACGYSATIVMPSIVPIERKHIIERYGAKTVIVPAKSTIRESIEACAEMAEELARQPNTFYARQFENPSNPRIHEESTGPEIVSQLPAEIGAFVAAAGTGGTLTGVARFLRRVMPAVKIVAVEPSNAAVLSGGVNDMHAQYGIGEGFVPAIFDHSVVDEVVTVEDDEAYAMASDLASKEGLFVGISSGTNVTAALKVAHALADGKPVVTILCDSGERYLSALNQCQ